MMEINQISEHTWELKVSENTMRELNNEYQRTGFDTRT